MKNWQVIVLCFSIIVSVSAATFYLKYQPKTLVTSNYGPVDLGKVFSERPMIDITLVDKYGNAGGDKEFANGISFYDRSKPVDEAMRNLANLWNLSSTDDEKIRYDKMSLIEDDVYTLKVRTYISYLSSNFINTPYTLTIEERTYRLSSDKKLKYDVEKIIDNNFKYTKNKISNNLFITDKVAYELEKL